jgi:hypothetical protein
LTAPLEPFEIDTFSALLVKALVVAHHMFQAGWTLPEALKAEAHLLVPVFFYR